MIGVTKYDIEQAAELCQLVASNPWCRCNKTLPNNPPHRAIYPVVAVEACWGLTEDGSPMDETEAQRLLKVVHLAEDTLNQLLIETSADVWDILHDLEAQARLEEGILPIGYELVTDNSLVN